VVALMLEVVIQMLEVVILKLGDQLRLISQFL
jgi:hypothetical protein